MTVFIGPKAPSLIEGGGTDRLGRSCADKLRSGAITLGPVADRLGSGANRLRSETVWGLARPCGCLRDRLEASKTVWRCCDSLHRAQG